MKNLEFYGIEKLSLVDFEGKIACTLFTLGCNFRCPFCHNSMLVSFTNNIEPIKREEYLDYLKKRIGILDAVVITGGEPTLMEGLKERIKEIKDLGYLVKLDTNGSNFEVLKELVDEGLIDYVAMDVKNSEEKYNITCGINNIDSFIDNVKKSISFLLENHVDYEFRTTLVREFHTIDDILKIKKLLRGAKKYYLQKFKSVDGCINPSLNEVSKEEAIKFKEVLENEINEVYLRGY